jgi:hypothetical protein
MPPILLGEYRNQNSRRYYPFADEATMVDTNGNALPTDFLVDGLLYPLNLTGAVYLSRVEQSVLYFADTEGATVKGTASVAGVSDGDAVAVYEPDYQRQIGVLVVGPGVAELGRGSTPRTFVAAATVFAADAFVPMNQQGVRGVLLDDGTLITGGVKFEGREGVVATSTIDSESRHRLRFDIVGVNPSSDEECPDEDCAPIQSVRVVRAVGSVFTIAELEEDTLAIFGHEVTLDDVCENQRDDRLPNESGELPLAAQTGKDPCVPTPQPVIPPPPDEEITLTFDVATCCPDGGLQVVAPNTDSARNLVEVVHVDHPAPPMHRVAMPRHGTYEGAMELSRRLRHPYLPYGSVLIGLRGIHRYRTGAYYHRGGR